MKTIALAIAVSLAIGGSAFAAERGDNPQVIAPLHGCMTLGIIKTVIKGAVFTPLNIGQFNYALGAYDATTPSHTPLPAADNALLMHSKGVSAILWMKSECASVTPPTRIGEEMAAHIQMIHPTAGETSDAGDSKDEMHL